MIALQESIALPGVPLGTTAWNTVSAAMVPDIIAIDDSLWKSFVIYSFRISIIYFYFVMDMVYI